MFAGLPLALTGIVLIAGSWRHVSLHMDGSVAEIAKALVGWTLAAGGLLAALGGETWFLDSRSRTFVRAWRLSRWTWRRRVVDFGAIGEVRCTRQVVGNGAQESFAVEIVLPGDKICRLAVRAHLHEALAMSARLCELLDLPLGRGSKKR